MIGHFNVKPFGDKFLLTNDMGKYAFLTKSELGQLVMDRVAANTALWETLSKGGFLLKGSEMDYIAENIPRMRGMKKALFSPTVLHIFVVSTACNLDCVYCQAHGEGDGKARLMDKETAERAVDIALESPASALSFEFQGGEPLLNYPVIKHAIEYAECQKGDKDVSYSVVSNLTLLTDEMIAFFCECDISLSTSLDGLQALHDLNRPFRGGGGSYAVVGDAVRRARAAGLRVGGIQTTTRASLGHAAEIIEAYCDFGFSSIFIRPLTPLGVARARWDSVGYTTSEFGDFYRDALDAIIKKNAQGCVLREEHASILLDKVLFGNGANYMEQRSPCGAGVGQMAYHVTGDVFTCDEGRMLFEMGDASFKLGNVFEHGYSDLLQSPVCRATCAASTLESIPSCCDCVYEPYCGICPVVNMAFDSDLIPKEPNSYHCGVYSEMFDSVFAIIQEQDDEIMSLLRGWVE